MLKSNNKFTSAIKSIAIVLALVAVLVMSLAGCTDEEARQMATDAANKANAAVTQAQLNDAVSAALADYAKKTDVMTQDGVATVVTDALKDYAKTADVLTMAQVETAIKTALADRYTKTEVDALISGLKTELQKLVNDQATELKNYADGKIDIATWNELTGTYQDLDNTKTVVGACKAVDYLLATVEANKASYTKANYDLAVSLCEAAKVRYIRATTLGDLNVDELENEIDEIPTIYSEALAVAALMAEIPVPMTTADAHQEALKKAEDAFAKWLNDYPTATEDIFKSKVSGEKYDGEELLGRTEYARTKLDTILVPAYTALNNEIEKYITDGKGIALPTTPDAAAILDSVVAKVVIGDELALGNIFKLYNDFVGVVHVGLNSYTEDTFNDNNGSADNRIPYWSVVEACFEALNVARFNELKTLLIADINGEMKEIVKTLKDRADNMENDILRNAIATLEHDMVSCINDLVYDANKYTGADYQKRFEVAAAHVANISAAITDTEATGTTEATVGVLQTLVNDYDALITAGKTYAEANATLEAAIEAAMTKVESAVAYPAN
ncbi:MAG: hypothetical protein IKA82_02125 [Clostridia bacterium]|nr:hypothetical protein [Clostridia bacterium]